MKLFKTAWLGIAALLPRILFYILQITLRSFSFLYNIYAGVAVFKKRERIPPFLFKELFFREFTLLVLQISCEKGAFEAQPWSITLGVRDIPQRWDHWQLHEGEHWSHSGKSEPNYGGSASASQGLHLVYQIPPAHSCGWVEAPSSNRILLTATKTINKTKVETSQEEPEDKPETETGIAEEGGSVELLQGEAPPDILHSGQLLAGAPGRPPPQRPLSSPIAQRDQAVVVIQTEQGHREAQGRRSWALVWWLFLMRCKEVSAIRVRAEVWDGHLLGQLCSSPTVWDINLLQDCHHDMAFCGPASSGDHQSFRPRVTRFIIHRERML